MKPNQKILLISNPYEHQRGNDELKKAMEEGYLIKQISSCSGTLYDNVNYVFCYVLLEKED